VAFVAQVEQRTASRADGATRQAKLIEIYRTEVFAVTTVLPSNLNRMFALAFEIELAE
jgi:hypothetical protein